MRVIHARTRIRDTRPHGPLPSQSEIDEWLEDHPGRREGIKEINNFDALNAGAEVGSGMLSSSRVILNNACLNFQKISCKLFRCIGYDIEVAMPLSGRIIQDQAQDSA
jgi:hypothetical protein